MPNQKLRPVQKSAPGLFVAYASYLICIFINIYENIKNVVHEWGYTYKINNISAAFSRRLLKVVLK